MNKILKISILSGFISTPLFAFAALEGIRELIVSIGEIVKLAIPIAVGAALLFFFWGLAKFILKSGDPKAKEEGRNIMIWGVVALFVMVSVWGIVGFIQRNLGIEGGGSIPGQLNDNVDSQIPLDNENCGTDSMGNPIPMC